MSCFVESITEAMKNLPILSTYTGADGMKYREDSNLPVEIFVVLLSVVVVAGLLQ